MEHVLAALVLVLVLSTVLVLVLVRRHHARIVDASRATLPVYSHARENARHVRQIAQGVLCYHHTDVPAIRQHLRTER